jgi:hypothetical protein
MSFKLAEAFVEISARGINTVEGSVGRLRGLFGNLTNLINGPLGAAMGALALPVSLGAGLTHAISEFASAEQAGMRLNAVLDATGHKAGFLAHQIGGIGQSIQGMSRIADDDVNAAAARLATFESIAGNVFERTLRDAAKLAVFLGGDMESATLQLGRALESPADGLSRLARAGVMFTDEQQNQIKSMAEAGNLAQAQTAILTALEGKLGDIAQQDLGTLSGGFAHLKNQIGDAFEELGGFTAGIVHLQDQMGVLERSASGWTQLFRNLRGADQEDTLAAVKDLDRLFFQSLDQAQRAAERGDINRARELYGEAAEAITEAWSLTPDQNSADADARRAKTANLLQDAWQKIAEATERANAAGRDMSGRKIFSGMDNLPDAKTVQAAADAARQRVEALRTPTEQFRDTMRALTIDFVTGLAGFDTFTRGAADASGKLPEVAARKKALAALDQERDKLMRDRFGWDNEIDHRPARGAADVADSGRGALFMGVEDMWRRLNEGANKSDNSKEQLAEQKRAANALVQMEQNGVKVKALEVAATVA